MRTLVTERLTDRVGAEVVGVDVDQLLGDDALPQLLLEELDRHGVLVFRGLHLEPEAQIAFCQRLGPIDWTRGYHPVDGIYVISLNPAKSASAEYLYGTFDFHIDGCTPLREEYPQMATLLSARALSDTGGETEFASTYAAYDDLTEDEKERFAELQVLHSIEASQRLAWPNPPAELVAMWRTRATNVLPLVWTHRSGRRSLVIGATADYVVGLSYAEGRDLLDDLLARATAPDRLYRHEWSVGDTVIWDNRGVVHRATRYEPTSPREMLRTTILGDEPIQ